MKSAVAEVLCVNSVEGPRVDPSVPCRAIAQPVAEGGVWSQKMLALEIALSTRAELRNFT